MNYNIDSVIKRLQEAQRKGKDIISENELIRIATPRINSIDEQIRLIDRGMIDKAVRRERLLLLNRISFTEAENATGIPRRTFYRWEKEGVLRCYKTRYTKTVFDLQELKETLIQIKQIKGQNVTEI